VVNRFIKAGRRFCVNRGSASEKTSGEKDFACGGDARGVEEETKEGMRITQRTLRNPGKKACARWYLA
jgi:hypothetical protein